MAVRVFFVNKLHDGMDPADYERWVREVDYPLARRLPAIGRYGVARLDGMVQGEGAVVRVRPSVVAHQPPRFDAVAREGSEAALDEAGPLSRSAVGLK